MTPAARWLRRVQIALFVIGVSLLGVALAASVPRWTYQAEQARALLSTLPVPHESDLASQAPSPAALNRVTSAQKVESLALNDAQNDASRSGASSEVPTSGALHEPRSENRHLSPSEPARERAKVVPLSLESRAALDPALLGRIEIPRLGLSALVREGDDESTLRRAVGYVPGTARPGAGGNTALAGHRDTFFRSLSRIKVDDHIRLVVPGQTYEYRVESLRVVEPTELSVLDSNGTEELTLVTCYPFRLLGPAPDRFIVKATRIQ